MNANLKSLYGGVIPKHLLQEIVVNGDVLVTGAQGLIGNAVAEILTFITREQNQQKVRIYLSSRKWNQTSIDYWSDFDNVQLVHNQEIRSLQNIDLVIHAASPSNITQIISIDELRKANLGILEEVLRITPKKIVFISTSEVYKGKETSEDAQYKSFSFENARDWYPIAKLETEDYLTRKIDESEFDLVVIRLFHTFGPGIRVDDGRSFADFLYSAARKEPLILKSTGNQTRTFMYITDAAEVILKLGTFDFGRKVVVNVGSQDPVTIREFAEEVAEISGTIVKMENHSEFKHSPNHQIIPNLTKIKSLGFLPKVSRKQGIMNTLNWIQSHSAVSEKIL